MALQVSKRNDEDIPEAEKLSDTKEYVLSKRMMARLRYPRHCKTKKLKRFAISCNLTIEAGGNHLGVYDGRTRVTTTPFGNPKPNTCRNIINALNYHCT